MRILIIDDVRSITDMLSAYLDLKGHDCIISNNGRNGLEMIKNEHFDCVILDIAMPEFSGFDVVYGLNKEGKMKENRIIVLTAVPLTEKEESELKQNGVKMILRKPINLKSLLTAIENNG